MRVPRTFIFVDLSGFTHFTETQGDDAAGRLLAAFRSVARDVASERGVRIAKWLGDGLMIVAMEQSDGIVFSMELQRRSATACAPLTLKATTTSVLLSTLPRDSATLPAHLKYSFLPIKLKNFLKACASLLTSPSCYADSLSLLKCVQLLATLFSPTATTPVNCGRVHRL